MPISVYTLYIEMTSFNANTCKCAADQLQVLMLLLGSVEGSRKKISATRGT